MCGVVPFPSVVRCHFLFYYIILRIALPHHMMPVRDGEALAGVHGCIFKYCTAIRRTALESR